MKPTMIAAAAAVGLVLTGCAASGGTGDLFAGSCGTGTAAADVAPAIHCFTRAIGRGDTETACDQLTESARRETVRDAARTGRDVTTCAAATRRALALVGTKARDTFAQLDRHLTVGSVSVSGTVAHARVSVVGLPGVPDASDTVTLYAEDGGWKLSTSSFHIDV